MHPSSVAPLNQVPADEDLAEQAHRGHGVPSQDPEHAAQFPLEPAEVKSVFLGGGMVAGAASGATVGVMVAGPVSVVVGGAVGAVIGVLGAAAASSIVSPEHSSSADPALAETVRPKKRLKRVLAVSDGPHRWTR